MSDTAAHADTDVDQGDLEVTRSCLTNCHDLMVVSVVPVLLDYGSAVLCNPTGSCFMVSFLKTNYRIMDILFLRHFRCHLNTYLSLSWVFAELAVVNAYFHCLRVMEAHVLSSPPFHLPEA